MTDYKKIKTLGDLKKSKWISKSIKTEIRDNLIKKWENKENPFPGIVGYEDSVIPELERAILSKHNVLLLGLRGQAKTRMARQMVLLLDEYIPVITGSEILDDPYAPISKFAIKQIQHLGDETPIHWVHRSERYGEKLATPDVSVADLIGDIDPIKAANLRLSFSDEEVIHFGIIPRSNRSIFVINELPDLQARIQVSLFNLLEEGDLQIRGFKLRLPLDIQFVFTANPEDYTNRGSIVTPLKDRIQSQILTHYPKTLEQSMAITEQESYAKDDRVNKIMVSDLVKRLIEQVAFEARSNEMVDKKSGVSARLTISASENAISAAERRSILNKEENTLVWINDLFGIIPSITGKVELVYEGEQEGPYQVAVHLLDKSIRTLFKQYFPDPELLKKKKKAASGKVENPYQSIIQWFDAGNHLNLFLDSKDEDKQQMLYKVSGLHALVKQHFPHIGDLENALLMEFVLYGLATHSLINKKMVDGKVSFNDLMGSMLNLGDGDFDLRELDNEGDF